MLETHYECPCLDKCPLNYAMSIIGGKWKMQIICALNNRGTLRYKMCIRDRSYAARGSVRQRMAKRQKKIDQREGQEDEYCRGSAEIR